MPTIRYANSNDASGIVRLMAEYCRELFGADIYLTVEKLQKDVFCTDSKNHVLVAEDGESSLVGFLAWESTYDWHCGTWGGSMSDFFVDKEHRGTGLALRLLAAFCDEVLKQGGEFFVALASDSGFAKKMSARFGVEDSGIHYTIAGRALSRIAKLRNSDLSTMVKNLPSRDDNFKPVEG